MPISLPQLILFSTLYLLLLFGIAWLSDQGIIPRRWAKHPLTYCLSLGVYASAWSFYASVDLAYRYGYGFLAVYLGISGAFLLGPVLLSPILRLTQTHQLASLADLLAFRFRSTWVGALTAGLMLVAALPLLALQIQAVVDSIGILTGTRHPARIALGFCAWIILFTILFGARHITPQDKHLGLVFAIAFESFIKLLAIAVISLFAIYGVFGGLGQLQLWLDQHPQTLPAMGAPLQRGPWMTLLLVSFASAIVTPHMYQMVFTENVRARSLATASWALPLLLLLISLAVPPILWAGLHLGLPGNPAYFTLTLGQFTHNRLLILIGYLGGLSAASSLIIVTTLALSGTVLNHLVLPLYQPPANTNIYRWLLWIKRALIALTILAGYAFYQVVGPQNQLAALGIVSLVATLQFLPGVFAVLYWPAANRRGLVAGQLAGIAVWALGMLLPLTQHLSALYLPWLDFSYVVNESNWHQAALASMAINIAVFTTVSWFGKPSSEEQETADACRIDNIQRPQRRELSAASAGEFIERLSNPLGSKAARREVDKALQELQLPANENRPYALRRLRDRLEANLSGLMGPSVAQGILRAFLPYRNDQEGDTTEDLNLIESRLEDYRSRLTGLAAELDTLRRHHRRTLQELPIGVCSLTKDHEVLMWNRAMERLSGVPAGQMVGSRLSALAEPWGRLLEDFIQQPEGHLYKQQLSQDQGLRWLNLHKASIAEPLSSNGNDLVLLVEDATEIQYLEEQLMHAERLASIGRLAAGVAHEIGNPITAIACLAQNQKDDYPQEEEILAASRQIIQQTERVSRILQSLMSFAHAGSRQSNEPVNLAQISDQAIALLYLDKSGPQVRFDNLCDPRHWVRGDPHRLVQVLINLLSNARDASAAGGVTRILSTANLHQIELSVEDDGSGIPKAIAGRLFDPFFTTKEPGVGTGLGLALVYSIVEEHHGKITVDSPIDSATGRGTRISISLPGYVET